MMILQKNIFRNASGPSTRVTFEGTLLKGIATLDRTDLNHSPSAGAEGGTEASQGREEAQARAQR